MESKTNRRGFMTNCAMMGGCCLAALVGRGTLAAKNAVRNGEKTEDAVPDGKKTEDAVPDPERYAYCGLLCESQCPLYKATIENDKELKKKVYDAWNWKEHFKIDFDPEKVFCWGCKPGDKPLKIGMDECDVRNCAMGAKIEACIRCRGLETCDKTLWKSWPGMKENALKVQKQYASGKDAVLVDVKKAEVK
jgi:hypothetical protein